MVKKLKKGKNKMIAGVISGFADYFGIDVTVTRLLFVLLMLFTGVVPLVIFYIIAYFVMPEK